MENLNEVKKEDNIYFKGPFWIIADSLHDIMQGNFDIECLRIPCYYDGTIIDQNNNPTRREQTHKNYWKTLESKYPGKNYTYYPRGRVGIYEDNGIAYIFFNSSMNNPFVINKIITEYGLENLEIEIELNDITQGNHYDFELR